MVLTIQNIKDAITEGKRVELHNGNYEVIRGACSPPDEYYLIRCKINNCCIGLHGMVGTKYETRTNYPIEDFYIVE